MSTESTLAALPVRQRGTLEIIDTAMKLYRRYFGVLMGWSALTAVLFLVTFTVSLGFGPLLVYPLIPGSGCCAIAAAVRGQRIGFGQVWEFTKPRYGALILITFLSSLLMGVAFGVVFVVSMLIALAGTWLFSALNAPTEITAIAAILGTIVALIVGSILSALAYAWLGLVQIIACLEDDKRGAVALGRAWDLMKGSWMRVLGLSTLLSIAVLAVMGIIGGTLALLSQGLSIDDFSKTPSALMGLFLTFSGFLALFSLFWNPIQTLILAVLYLDLRVRKEALDLEWSSYASAPPPMSASEPAPNQLADNTAAPELSPASMSGYAPGSSAPDGEAMRPPQPATTAPPPAAPTPRPPAPANVASPEMSPLTLEKPVAPAELTVAPSVETSSFSGAPSTRIPSSQDAFDFSSSFNAGADEPISFDDNEEKDEDEKA